MIKVYVRHPHQATQLSREIRKRFPSFRVDGPSPSARAFETEAGPAEVYACADELDIKRAEIDLSRVGAASHALEFKCGADNAWLITVTDDGTHGMDWTASRLGVLWAKGWARTRTADDCKVAAYNAGVYAFVMGEVRS